MGMPQLELRQGLNALFIIYIKHPVTIYRVRHSVTGCKIQVDAAPFWENESTSNQVDNRNSIHKVAWSPKMPV